jgi:hypothetical protein
MKDLVLRTTAVAGVALTLLLFASPGEAAGPTAQECISTNELAIKARSEARLLDARDKLLACASLSCPGEIRAECERRLADVNAAIPTVVFDVRDAAGNDLIGVRVSMDGKPLAARLDGTAIRLDPGVHAFRFELDARAPVEKSLTIHEGEKARRETVVLGTAAQPATAPASTAGGEPSEPSSSPLRTVGWIVAGVGLAGLVTGAVTGVLAISDKGQASCDGQGYNCQAGPLSDSKTMAGISTGAFIAGGVLAAAGVGVVLFAPKGGARAEVTATSGPGTLGLRLGGTF